MVSNYDGFTDNLPISYEPYVLVKQCNVREFLRQFSEILDIKPKPAFRRLYAAKSERKSIRVRSMLWSSIPK